MAMNKKEQAAMDAALEEIRIMRALRWSEQKEIVRDVPAPSANESGYRYSDGWTYHSYGSAMSVGEVTRMWSSSVTHGRRAKDGSVPPHSASQRAIHLYSTRALALRALRIDLERRYAESLADVDAMIEAEEGPTP